MLRHQKQGSSAALSAFKAPGQMTGKRRVILGESHPPVKQALGFPAGFRRLVPQHLRH